MGWDDNFYFTKQERNGILVFFVASLTVLAITRYLPVAPSYQSDIDLKSFYNLSENPEYSGIEGDEEYGIGHDFTHSDSYKSNRNFFQKETFLFDPNTVSKDSLLRLGFSPFAAGNLVNYRNKGGKIRNIEKLKSIYGVDTVLVESLRPYIQFNDDPSKKYNTTEKITPISTVSLAFTELNSADSTDLIRIKGIGPYKANRILNYRDKLGGFLYPEQLMEIPQITDSLFNEIQHLLDVDESKIKAININTADYRALIRHPYMTQQAVNLILNYRKQHGAFKDPKEIKRIRAFNESFVNKILPYLSVSDHSEM